MPNRFTLNTLLQFGTRGLELVSGLFVNAWIARHWGHEAFGELAFVLGLATACAFLFDFGLGSLLIRSIARAPREARAHLRAGLRALIRLGCFGGLVLLALGALTAPGVPLLVLLLAGVQLALSAANQVLRATFYAFERMELEAVAVTAERLCWTGAGLWLALGRPDLSQLFGWIVLSKLLSVGVSVGMYWRFIRPHTEAGARASGSTLALLREALPFGLNQGFYTLAGTLDILLLSWWASSAATGQYRAAGMIVMALTLGALAINNALFPRMSAGSAETRARIARASGRLAIWLAVPLAAFCALYAPQLVDLIFGPAYREAALVLQLLCLSLPLRFLNHALGTTLTACDRQAARMRAMGAATAVNLLANALLIWRYEAVGACLAVLASELALLVLLASACRSAAGSACLDLPAALKAALLSAGLLALLFGLGASWPLAGLALGLSYSLILMLPGGLSAFERQLIFQRST